MSEIKTDIEYGEIKGEIKELYDGKASSIIVKLNNVPYAKEKIGQKINLLLTKYVKNKEIRTDTDDNSYVKLPNGGKYDEWGLGKWSLYWYEKEKQKKQQQKEKGKGIELYNENEIEVHMTTDNPLGSDELAKIATEIKNEIKNVLEEEKSSK